MKFSIRNRFNTLGNDKKKFNCVCLHYVENAKLPVFKKVGVGAIEHFVIGEGDSFFIVLEYFGQEMPPSDNAFKVYSNFFTTGGGWNYDVDNKACKISQGIPWILRIFFSKNLKYSYKFESSSFSTHFQIKYPFDKQLNDSGNVSIGDDNQPSLPRFRNPKVPIPTVV